MAWVARAGPEPVFLGSPGLWPVQTEDPRLWVLPTSPLLLLGARDEALPRGPRSWVPRGAWEAGLQLRSIALGVGGCKELG